MILQKSISNRIDFNIISTFLNKTTVYKSGYIQNCTSMLASAKMLAKYFPSLFLGFLVFSVSINLSNASDAISQDQFISGNQTISSNGGTFELGFFTPGNSKNYYIGIWYKKSKQTIVWVANRETPISDPSTSKLKLAKDGNLILASQSKPLVWSSNATTPSNSSTATKIAVLLETGNFVIREQSNSSAVIWQSFDYPTDTWLPDGWLGVNKLTGEYQRMTAWKNSEDPAPGNFVDTVDPSGVDQFTLLWNMSKSYFNTGVWRGDYFTALAVNGIDLCTYEFIDDEVHKRLTCKPKAKRILARNVIHSYGQVQWVMFDDDNGWEVKWTAPVSPCDVYSACGAFGICDKSKNPPCSCLTGFSPTSVRDWEHEGWSSGCMRKTNLQCNGNNTTSEEADGFLVIPNVLLPLDSQTIEAKNAEDCESACLKSCSCVGYAYETGCSIWNREIRDLQALAQGDINASTLYLRLAASDLQQSSSENELIAKISVSAAVGIAVSLIILFFIWMFQKRRVGVSTVSGGLLVSFTYSQLQRITKNFSEKLGGGSFGSVFGGVLPDLSNVAVKRLEGVQQGEKEFRNELVTLGRIQHVNLVRLHGFCCERTEKILVYEYMPNGSLDHYLFRKGSECLDWKTRYQIILGIARGLMYLHEECRECIIHCDIKPENVLLDSELNPKLSDFGMAKLLGHDFSRVLTTVRGTIGYLAPEWIEGLPITPKADVYSFGMMLFEVVSGRRNTRLAEDGSIKYFPVKAARRVIGGETLSLLDEDLGGCADILELNKVCRVACWCIQDAEKDRPTMGEVVKALEGVLELETPPFPTNLGHLGAEEDHTVVHVY